MFAQVPPEYMRSQHERHAVKMKIEDSKKMTTKTKRANITQRRSELVIGLRAACFQFMHNAEISGSNPFCDAFENFCHTPAHH